MQISGKHFPFNATTPDLRYTPDDDDDFGLISCRATNEMGTMEEPCVFTIIPAGRKEGHKVLPVDFLSSQRRNPLRSLQPPGITPHAPICRCIITLSGLIPAGENFPRPHRGI